MTPDYTADPTQPCPELKPIVAMMPVVFGWACPHPGCDFSLVHVPRGETTQQLKALIRKHWRMEHAGLPR